jgi:hypothetical protein
MSKSQSNKSENNIGLIASGLIGLGCLTALGVGAIALPVAIGIGAVTFGALGAIELTNMSKNNKVEIKSEVFSQFDSRIASAIPIKERSDIGSESPKIDWNKTSKEINAGREIGRKIAEEHLSDPATTIENSSVIKKYQNLCEKEERKNTNSQEAKDAKFKFRVAYVAKEIAIDFTKNTEPTEMLEAYKQDNEFKKVGSSFQTLRENAIAKSAFDEVAKVIAKHQQKPSSNLGSPRVNQWSRGEEKINI